MRAQGLRGFLPVSLLAFGLALGGCTGDDPEPTPQPSSPRVATAGGPRPSQGLPSASASTLATPPGPPAAPTAPAPSTAGGLTESDLAIPDGWSPTARPGSPEEGYLGNGTWVHATSAPHSAFAAISLGCTDLLAYPEPSAALEGTLTDASGSFGIGLTLEFASEADAAAYFAEWIRQAEACVGTSTERLASSPDTWLGRRNLDTVWSETVGVRGAHVVLLIVEDPEADLSGVLG